MSRHVDVAGLVVAGIGFFLTRFTVTLAIYDDPVRFYFAGVVPLVLGLGLAAFGVALAVVDLESDFVRTTARWCVVGTGAMFVLVVLTLVGSTDGFTPDLATVRSRTYLSNFLIGGSVGGTLTGLYAARNRRQRNVLRHQTNRLQVLNRLLRHEVLNSVTAIQGYTTLVGEDDRRAAHVIEERSNDIVDAIEEVNYLTATTEPERSNDSAVEVGACLDASVRAVTDRHPDADVSVELESPSLLVRATERVEHVFVHLLENAVVHSSPGDPRVEVTAEETPRTVRVSVRDDGPGLPESEQTLLESGEIDEFDNPRKGFGLNVVRLLVESYRGSIETDAGPEGTTITVALPKATGGGPGDEPTGLVGSTGRPAIPQLLVTLGAALIAGVCFGVSSELLGGSIGIIGVLYGVADPVVGWITHEFHSVVFGFVFAGLVSLVPSADRNRVPTYVGIGIAWGIVLWLLAAGLVSAIWLQLLGIPAPIPNLSVVSLVNHVVWGVSIGVLTALGYEHVAPWLARFDWLSRRG